MERSYKIAGLLVNMEYRTGIFPTTVPYEIGKVETPDMSVAAEYRYLKRSREEIRKLSMDKKAFLEHTAIASSFYNQLLEFDGCVIHSSAIIMDGKAYLFTADSGTGKSTHTSLYRRVYGDDRARILNDDKPAVRLEDGQFFAYGTPWSGKTNLNLNLRVPIGGVCLLRRGETNTIRRMSTREALFAVLGQTIRPEEPERMQRLMELLGKLIVQIPVWEMHCNMEPDAPRVSYEAMSGAGKEEER